MKTGNTGLYRWWRCKSYSASMEPGHEDREYLIVFPTLMFSWTCLNGARS